MKQQIVQWLEYRQAARALREKKRLLRERAGRMVARNLKNGYLMLASHCDDALDTTTDPYYLRFQRRFARLIEREHRVAAGKPAFHS